MISYESREDLEIFGMIVGIDNCNSVDAAYRIQLQNMLENFQGLYYKLGLIHGKPRNESDTYENYMQLHYYAQKAQELFHKVYGKDKPSIWLAMSDNISQYITQMSKEMVQDFRWRKFGRWSRS